MQNPLPDLSKSFLIFKIQEQAIINNSGSMQAEAWVNGLINTPSIAMREIKDQLLGGAELTVRTCLGNKATNLIIEYYDITPDQIEAGLIRVSVQASQADADPGVSDKMLSAWANQFKTTGHE